MENIYKQSLMNYSGPHGEYDDFDDEVHQLSHPPLHPWSKSIELPPTPPPALPTGLRSHMIVTESHHVHDSGMSDGVYSSIMTLSR